MKIKDIPLDNRPRERMIKFGIKSLSDSEVLSLIIQKGLKNENVIDLSNRVISKYGLDKLRRVSLKELESIKGIGIVKAMQIIAAIEFSNRLKNSSNNLQIKFAHNVYKHMRDKLSNLTQEHFIVLMLNTKNKIIKEDTIAIGTLDTVSIHPREVFKNAIIESASSIIIVHNHPSGDPMPSNADLEITKRIIDTGKIVGIEVLDHIIIGRDSYWSWNEGS